MKIHLDKKLGIQFVYELPVNAIKVTKITQLYRRKEGVSKSKKLTLEDIEPDTNIYAPIESAVKESEYHCVKIEENTNPLYFNKWIKTGQVYIVRTKKGRSL